MSDPTMLGHMPDDAFDAVARHIRLARCTEAAISKSPYTVLGLVSDGLVVAAPYIAAAALEQAANDMFTPPIESRPALGVYKRLRARAAELREEADR